MPIYECECPTHGRFEVSRKMSEANNIRCVCGNQVRIIPSVVNHTFGFRLTEASHIPGHKDELERDV